MIFEYEFAEDNGKVHMIEFLEGLSFKERAKIFAYIDKLIELKSNGISLKGNLSKHLGNGIFELRVSFENTISRSLYFYELQQQVVFTHGFIKKEHYCPVKIEHPEGALPLVI